MFQRLPFLLLLLCVTPVQALRIVSLLPSHTEILDSLGAGAEVVGVTSFDSPNPRYPSRQNVGDLLHPNLERIIALKPDLIVAEQWRSSRAVPRLARMGLNVLETPLPHSMNDIYKTIETIGSSSGHGKEAAHVIATMKDRVTALTASENRPKRPIKVFIEIDRPLWTVGPDFISEAITLAGGKNIFGDLKGNAAQVSSEVVIARDPEVIITFETPTKEIMGRAGWGQITATRRQAIISDIPPELLTHPSPLLIEGMERLARRLNELSKP